MLKYILPRQLAKILKNGDPTPPVQLAFVLFFTLVKMLFGETTFHLGLQSSAADIVIALSVLIAIYLAFLANGGGSGDSFILKYATLGSLLGLWVYGGGFVAFVAVTYGASIVFAGSEFVATIHRHFQIIYACISSPIYILLIRRYFVLVRS